MAEKFHVVIVDKQGKVVWSGDAKEGRVLASGRFGMLVWSAGKKGAFEGLDGSGNVLWRKQIRKVLDFSTSDYGTSVLVLDDRRNRGRLRFILGD